MSPFSGPVRMYRYRGDDRPAMQRRRDMEFMTLIATYFIGTTAALMALTAATAGRR